MDEFTSSRAMGLEWFPKAATPKERSAQWWPTPLSEPEPALQECIPGWSRTLPWMTWTQRSSCLANPAQSYIWLGHWKYKHSSGASIQSDSYSTANPPNHAIILLRESTLRWWRLQNPPKQCKARLILRQTDLLGKPSMHRWLSLQWLQSASQGKEGNARNWKLMATQGSALTEHKRERRWLHHASTHAVDWTQNWCWGRGMCKGQPIPDPQPNQGGGRKACILNQRSSDFPSLAQVNWL